MLYGNVMSRSLSSKTWIQVIVIVIVIVTVLCASAPVAVASESNSNTSNDTELESIDAVTLIRRYSKWKRMFDLAISHHAPVRQRRWGGFCPEGNCYHLVALQTFPGTGTTWTQRLYAAVTGVIPESIYPDDGTGLTFHGARSVNCTEGSEDFANLFCSVPDLVNGGLRSGSSPAFVKTHFASHHGEDSWTRIVRLARDPLDCSHFAKMFDGSSNGDSVAVGSITGMRLRVRWHCRALQHALNNLQPVLLVHYEDLLKRPEYELHEIINFVGANSSQQLDLMRLVDAVKRFPPKIKEHSCLNSAPEVISAESFASLLNEKVTISPYFCEWYNTDKQTLVQAIEVLEEELSAWLSTGTCRDMDELALEHDPRLFFIL